MLYACLLVPVTALVIAETLFPVTELCVGPGQLYGKGKCFCLCQNTTGEWWEKKKKGLFTSFIMVLLD